MGWTRFGSVCEPNDLGEAKRPGEQRLRAGDTLSLGVSDARSEQGSEVRVHAPVSLEECVRIFQRRSGVYVQWQESNGCRKVLRLALVGKALKVRKPTSGSGVKQSRKDVRGPNR